MMLPLIPSLGFSAVRMPCDDNEIPGGSESLVEARLNVPPERTPVGNVSDRSTVTFESPARNISQGVGSQPAFGKVSSWLLPQPATAIALPSAQNFSSSRRFAEVFIAFAAYGCLVVIRCSNEPSSSYHGLRCTTVNLVHPEFPLAVV